MDRAISYIAAPGLPIQMEVLRWPRLKGRPLVIVPQLKERALIRAASQEALAAGIQKGMFLSHAQKLCRNISVLPFDDGYYRAGSESIARAAGVISPIVEPAHLGSVFVDISHVAQNVAYARELCECVLRQIRTLGITPKIGLASNKLVSRIAAAAAPASDIHVVDPGHEKTFLYPRLAHHLPAVDADIWRRLELMGLKRIGSLAALSADDLRILFGRAGARLFEQANGVDFEPVISAKPQTGKAYGRVLTPDTNDVEVLLSHALRLAEQASMELRAERLNATRLVLTLEYADYKKTTTALRVSQPSCEEQKIKAAVRTLLERGLKRRVSVRILTLQITGTIPHVRQLSLFDQPLLEKRRQIDHALDLVRQKFGSTKIGYAQTVCDS